MKNNLYTGGKDKDYFKLVVGERGKVRFDVNNTKVKISLLYKSGTTIASNYDANTSSIKKIFDADLAKGEYLILVENADATTDSIPYEIQTTLSTTGEILLDSGASFEKFSTISAFSYVNSYSYVLKGGNFTRLSNILAPTKTEYMPELNGDYQLSMFSYQDVGSSKEKTYIAKIDLAGNTSNKVILVTYDIQQDQFNRRSDFNMNGIVDEKVLLIDKDEYIYYYDGDSLYISPLYNTITAEQFWVENLTDVKVVGDVMYLVTSKYIQMVDVSDKGNINAAKILDTIYVANAKSIYVEKGANRLFVGANDKIEVYNISDKTSATQLNEIAISFNDNDLYYTGTPTSIYILGDMIYTTVDEVGLVMLKIDSFGVLSLQDKVLNLGENFSGIYTYRGDALNYIVGDELKVHFLSSQVLNPDATGTTTLVGDVKEGSGAFEGCFIATAAYGSYFEPNVKVLRDFRDKYLLHNELGRAFVDLYYEHSPAIARSIVGNEFVKSLVRFVLTPLVFIIEYPIVLILLMMLFFLAYKKTKQNSKNKLGIL